MPILSFSQVIRLAFTPTWSRHGSKEVRYSTEAIPKTKSTQQAATKSSELPAITTYMNKGNMMNRLNTLGMNRQINHVVVSVITAILLALTGLISHSEAQIAVKGETVYTM